jgi:uncharacterized protein DUF6932
MSEEKGPRMALPAFNSQGDLPEGVYRAPLEEVVQRFGGGTTMRQTATASLLRIYHAAQGTGKLERFIILGSYITAKTEPNDVDIVLVMADDFQYQHCSGEVRDLFVHDQANVTFGAIVFWVRPAAILIGTLDDFVAHWQVKRDKTRRGIVEVTP